MDNTKIKSLDQYVRLISEFRSDNPSLDLFYRGENRFYKERIPSIYRIKDNRIAIESNNYYKRLAITSDNERFVNGSLFDRLTELQHFGGLTRLLDISSNALIALFFATEGNDTDDGYIYIYQNDRLNIKSREGHTAFLKTVVNYLNIDLVQNFIAGKDNHGREINNKADIDVMDSTFSETIRVLDKEQRPFNKFDKMREDLKNAQIIQLPKLNVRIAHQQGAFIFPAFEEATSTKNVSKSIDALSFKVKVEDKTEPEPVILRIPKESKHAIQRELAGAGINAGTVYPDFKHQSAYVVQETLGFNDNIPSFDIIKDLTSTIQKNHYLFDGNSSSPEWDRFSDFVKKSTVENTQLLKMPDDKFYMYEELSSKIAYNNSGASQSSLVSKEYYGLLTPSLNSNKNYRLVSLGVYGIGEKHIENLLNHFEQSNSYARTHSLIKDLTDPIVVKAIKSSDSYLSRLLNAAFDNDQIFYLLWDSDVMDYFIDITKDLQTFRSEKTKRLIKKLEYILNQKNTDHYIYDVLAEFKEHNAP